MSEKTTMRMISRRRFATLLAAVPLLSTAGLCGAAAEGLSARGRQAAEAILRGLVDRGAVPGVSYSIGNAHETLAVGAFGLRDLKPRLPMEADTRCALASVSKQFAAAAIYLLQQRGAVSLHAPIATYVPDYRYGRQMTLALLLTMRAGVTADDEACEKPIDGKLNDKTLVANLNRHPLDFPPGRYFAYTNCGYDLLGVIVERVSHMTFARFIETNFFKPLGMRSSYVLGERNDENFARGYEPQGSGWKKEPPTAADRAFASGNLVSTPADMQRWDRSLLTATILSRESLRRMFTVPTSGGTAHTHYASGWFVESSGVIWHGGTLAGYATANMLIPKTGHAIAILGNSAPSKWRAEETARAVYNASGLGPAIPPLAKRTRSTRPS